MRRPVPGLTLDDLKLAERLGMTPQAFRSQKQSGAIRAAQIARTPAKRGRPRAPKPCPCIASTLDKLIANLTPLCWNCSGKGDFPQPCPTCGKRR